MVRKKNEKRVKKTMIIKQQVAPYTHSFLSIHVDDDNSNNDDVMMMLFSRRKDI